MEEQEKIQKPDDEGVRHSDEDGSADGGVVLSEEEEAKTIQSVGGEGLNTCDAESVGVVESKIVYSPPHGRDHT